jgi:hydrogenase maturation protein HypF
VLDHQLATGFGCAPTSSVGRLFDAVAALAGVRQVVDYEAQAAVELEGLARGVPDDGPTYPLAPAGGADGEPLVADPSALVRAVVADVRAGVPAAVVGRRFHTTLAGFARDIAQRAREALGLRTVALTGGVFQNALLLSQSRAALRDDGFTVLCHRQVPPNDGGLALGQALVGSTR